MINSLLILEMIFYCPNKESAIRDARTPGNDPQVIRIPRHRQYVSVSTFRAAILPNGGDGMHHFKKLA